MRGISRERQDSERIGLYNVIVHPHGYLLLEIGIIIVSSSSLLLSRSLYLSISHSSESEVGGDRRRMIT